MPLLSQVETLASLYTVMFIRRIWWDRQIEPVAESSAYPQLL